MIKKELHFVWITKDGKQFLDKDEAEKHQQMIEPSDLIDQWFNKLKGEQNGNIFWVFNGCNRYGSYYGYYNRIG